MIVMKREITINPNKDKVLSSCPHVAQARTEPKKSPSKVNGPLQVWTVSLGSETRNSASNTRWRLCPPRFLGTANMWSWQKYLLALSLCSLDVSLCYS